MAVNDERGRRDRVSQPPRDCPHIHPLPDQQGGVGMSSSARNAGIDMATSQYIAFIDPDDYIATDFYEKLYRGLIDNGAELAVSGTFIIEETESSFLIAVFFMGFSPFSKITAP